VRRSDRRSADRERRYDPAVVSALTAGLMLLVAAYGIAALVLTAMGRAPREYLVIASMVLSVLVVVMVVIAAGLLVAGERPDELGTFVGYLVVAVVLLPIGTLWALTERSRWGTGVLAVACFTLLVVIVRLQDLWSTTGG
jgi:membrane-bound acyltransferase YfiQ involved in biofilm formation